jgi:hypothetical protein
MVYCYFSYADKTDYRIENPAVRLKSFTISHGWILVKFCSLITAESVLLRKSRNTV